MSKLFTFLSFVLLHGCALITQESFYEGLRSNQKAKADKSIDNLNELPPYDRYKKERETLKK